MVCKGRGDGRRERKEADERASWAGQEAMPSFQARPSQSRLCDSPDRPSRSPCLPLGLGRVSGWVGQGGVAQGWSQGLEGIPLVNSSRVSVVETTAHRVLLMEDCRVGHFASLGRLGACKTSGSEGGGD